MRERTYKRHKSEGMNKEINERRKIINEAKATNIHDRSNKENKEEIMIMKREKKKRKSYA